MQNQKEYLALLLKEAEKSLQDFNKNYNSFTDEELNWKPDSESWSIGEVFEHIIQSNSLYYDKFEEIIKTKSVLHDSDNPPFKNTFIGKMIIKAIHPDTAKKLKTSKVFEPAESNVNRDILVKFETQHNKLIDFLKRSGKVHLSKIKIPSPANKLIRYSIGDAYETLVYHTQRHLNQVGRVAEMYKRSKGIGV